MSLFAELASLVPSDRLLYRIGPLSAGETPSWEEAARHALREPVAGPPIAGLAASARSAVILADDLTRPTPRDRLLPPLLDALNAAGVDDARVTVLVALGTHRYMSPAELHARFGDAVCNRVRVVNHEWKDPGTFVDLGATRRGTPVRVNRLALEADLMIGTGSVVPHIWAGWGGGGKIVLPGICSAESIAPTHALAGVGGALMDVSGTIENACREEIDLVARQVGLDCILNAVVGAEERCAWCGFGEPVATHRAAVDAARRVFVRPVPCLADIVVADARPAVKDYWQGVKALAHAARGVRRGGTVLLAGEFYEGIAASHPQFALWSARSHDEIVAADRRGRICDHVVVTTLRLHALLCEHCDVVCVSEGMSVDDQVKLGFRPARDAGDALRLAQDRQGAAAAFGVIECAGDVLPDAP